MSEDHSSIVCLSDVILIATVGCVRYAKSDEFDPRIVFMSHIRGSREFLCRLARSVRWQAHGRERVLDEIKSDTQGDVHISVCIWTHTTPCKCKIVTNKSYAKRSSGMSSTVNLVSQGFKLAFGRLRKRLLQFSRGMECRSVFRRLVVRIGRAWKIAPLTQSLRSRDLEIMLSPHWRQRPSSSISLLRPPSSPWFYRG